VTISETIELNDKAQGGEQEKNTVKRNRERKKDGGQKNAVREESKMNGNSDPALHKGDPSGHEKCGCTQGRQRSQNGEKRLGARPVPAKKRTRGTHGGRMLKKKATAVKIGDNEFSIVSGKKRGTNLRSTLK